MKKLIVIAIAALPVVAMADVTVYGTLAVGVEASHDFIVGTGATSSVGKVDSYRSNIGFKGTEDLGNGLKTLWQVESAISIDNSTTANVNGTVTAGNVNTFATRDSFIGLSGDFGTVKMGRLSTFANTDSNLDAWWGNYVNGANGFSPNNPLSGFNAIARTHIRMNNAIEYRTPSLSGFTAQVVYAMGETRTVNTNGNPALLTGSYELGLKYENSGYYGMSTYITSQNTSRQGGSNWLWSLEGGYNANQLLMAGVFQQSLVRVGSDTALTVPVVPNNPSFGGLVGLSDINILTLATNQGIGLGTNSTVTQNEAALILGYTLGQFQPHFQPHFQYAHGWSAKLNEQVINNSGYNQYILGVNYALSKRTQAQVSYGLIQHQYQYSDLSAAGPSGKANTQTVSLGLIHRF